MGMSAKGAALNQVRSAKCRAFGAHPPEGINHGLTAVAIASRPFGPLAQLMQRLRRNEVPTVSRVYCSQR